MIYRPNLPTFGDEEIDFKDLMNHPLARVYGETNEELRNILKKITGKYSKRRRSNVAVIIDRIVFIGSFLFYCLLSNHSFQTNPNSAY